MLAKLVSFVVLQGIRTNIAKKPYIFVIGSGPPVSPSGSAHVYVLIHLSAIAFETNHRKNSYETKMTTMNEMMQDY